MNTKQRQGNVDKRTDPGEVHNNGEDGQDNGNNNGLLGADFCIQHTAQNTSHKGQSSCKSQHQQNLFSLIAAGHHAGEEVRHNADGG